MIELRKITLSLEIKAVGHFGGRPVAVTRANLHWF
jgi:hypothetical protein